MCIQCARLYVERHSTAAQQDWAGFLAQFGPCTGPLSMENYEELVSLGVFVQPATLTQVLLDSLPTAYETMYVCGATLLVCDTFPGYVVPTLNDGTHYGAGSAAVHKRQLSNLPDHKVWANYARKFQRHDPSLCGIAKYAEVDDIGYWAWKLKSEPTLPSQMFENYEQFPTVPLAIPGAATWGWSAETRAKWMTRTYVESDFHVLFYSMRGDPNPIHLPQNLLKLVDYFTIAFRHWCLHNTWHPAITSNTINIADILPGQRPAQDFKPRVEMARPTSITPMVFEEATEIPPATPYPIVAERSADVTPAPPPQPTFVGNHDIPIPKDNWDNLMTIANFMGNIGSVADQVQGEHRTQVQRVLTALKAGGIMAGTGAVTGLIATVYSLCRMIFGSGGTWDLITATIIALVGQITAIVGVLLPIIEMKSLMTNLFKGLDPFVRGVMQSNPADSQEAWGTGVSVTKVLSVVIASIISATTGKDQIGKQLKNLGSITKGVKDCEEFVTEVSWNLFGYDISGKKETLSLLKQLQEEGVKIGGKPSCTWDSAYITEATEWLTQVNEVIRLLGRDVNTSTLLPLVARIQTSVADARMFEQSKMAKLTPVVLSFWGPPGHGKSHAAESMVADMAKMLDDTSDIYRMKGTTHYPHYGGQRWLMLDEIGASMTPSDTLANDLNELFSASMKNMAGAALPDKHQYPQFYTAFCCSNEPLASLNIGMVPSAWAAFQTRVESIQVTHTGHRDGLSRDNQAWQKDYSDIEFLWTTSDQKWIDSINRFLVTQKLPTLRITGGKVRMNYQQTVAMIMLKIKSNVERFRARKTQVGNRPALFTEKCDFKDVFTLQNDEGATLPHVTYICGGSGVGKTASMRTLLKGLSSTQGVPVYWTGTYDINTDSYPDKACFVIDDVFDPTPAGAHAYVCFVNKLKRTQRLVVISNYGPQGTGLLPWRLASWMLGKSRLTKPVEQISEERLHCPGFVRRAGWDRDPMMRIVYWGPSGPICKDPQGDTAIWDVRTLLSDWKVHAAHRHVEIHLARPATVPFSMEESDLWLEAPNQTISELASLTAVINAAKHTSPRFLKKSPAVISSFVNGRVMGGMPTLAEQEIFVHGANSIIPGIKARIIVANVDVWLDGTEMWVGAIMENNYVTIHDTTAVFSHMMDDGESKVIHVRRADAIAIMLSEWNSCDDPLMYDAIQARAFFPKEWAQLCADPAWQPTFREKVVAWKNWLLRQLTLFWETYIKPHWWLVALITTLFAGLATYAAIKVYAGNKISDANVDLLYVAVKSAMQRQGKHHKYPGEYGFTGSNKGGKLESTTGKGDQDDKEEREEFKKNLMHTVNNDRDLWDGDRHFKVQTRFSDDLYMKYSKSKKMFLPTDQHGSWVDYGTEKPQRWDMYNGRHVDELISEKHADRFLRNIVGIERSDGGTAFALMLNTSIGVTSFHCTNDEPLKVYDDRDKTIRYGQVIHRNAEREIAFISLTVDEAGHYPYQGCYQSLTGYLRPENQLSAVKRAWIAIARPGHTYVEGGSYSYHIDMQQAGLLGTEDWKVGGRVAFSTNMSVTTLGTCGSPVFTLVDGSPVLLGIHSAYFFARGSSLSSVLCNEAWLECAEAQIQKQQRMSDYMEADFLHSSLVDRKELARTFTPREVSNFFTVRGDPPALTPHGPGLEFKAVVKTFSKSDSNIKMYPLEIPFVSDAFPLDRIPVYSAEHIKANFPDKIPDDAHGVKHVAYIRAIACEQNVYKPEQTERLRQLARQLGEHFAFKTGTKARKIRPLSVPECIAGIDVMDPIKRSTSAGQVLGVLFNVTDKNLLWGDASDGYAWKDNDAARFLARVVDQQWEMAARGERLSVPASVKLKAEKLEFAKAWKKRAFIVMPVNDVINLRRLLAPIQMAFRTMGAESPFIIQNDPNMIWDSLYRQLTAVGQNIIAIDASSFDWTVPGSVITALDEFFGAFYSAGHDADSQRGIKKKLRVLLEEHAFKPICFDNALCAKQGGVCSGMYGTSLVDSSAMLLMLYSCYADLVAPDVDSFIEHICSKHGGDDLILAVSDMKIEGFNFPLIRQYFADVFGIQLTLDTKDPTQNTKSTNMDEATFLGRHWVRMTNYPNTFQPRLRVTALSGASQYTRMTRDIDILGQLECVLPDLVAYGREKYDSYNYGIEQWAKSRGLTREVDTFDQAERKRWLAIQEQRLPLEIISLSTAELTEELTPKRSKLPEITVKNKKKEMAEIRLNLNAVMARVSTAKEFLDTIEAKTFAILPETLFDHGTAELKVKCFPKLRLPFFQSASFWLLNNFCRSFQACDKEFKARRFALVAMIKNHDLKAENIPLHRLVSLITDLSAHLEDPQAWDEFRSWYGATPTVPVVRKDMDRAMDTPGTGRTVQPMAPIAPPISVKDSSGPMLMESGGYMPALSAYAGYGDSVFHSIFKPRELLTITVGTATAAGTILFDQSLNPWDPKCVGDWAAWYARLHRRCVPGGVTFTITLSAPATAFGIIRMTLLPAQANPTSLDTKELEVFTHVDLDIALKTTISITARFSTLHEVVQLERDSNFEYGRILISALTPIQNSFGAGITVPLRISSNITMDTKYVMPEYNLLFGGGGASAPPPVPQGVFRPVIDGEEYSTLPIEDFNVGFGTTFGAKSAGPFMQIVNGNKISVLGGMAQNISDIDTEPQIRSYSDFLQWAQSLDTSPISLAMIKPTASSAYAIATTLGLDFLDSGRKIPDPHFTYNTYDGLLAWQEPSSVLQKPFTANPTGNNEVRYTVDGGKHRNTCINNIGTTDPAIPFNFQIAIGTSRAISGFQNHSILADMNFLPQLYWTDGNGTQTQPEDGDTSLTAIVGRMDNPNINYKGQIVCTQTSVGVESQSTEGGLRVVRFMGPDAVIPGVLAGCTSSTWPLGPSETAYRESLSLWFRNHPGTPGFIYQLAERGGRSVGHVLLNQYGAFMLPKTADRYWTHDNSTSDWAWTAQGPTTTEWANIPTFGEGWVSRTVDPVTVSRSHGDEDLYNMPLQGVQMPYAYTPDCEVTVTRNTAVLARRPPRYIRKDMWGVAAGIGGMANGLSGVLGQQAAWAQQSDLQSAYFDQQKWLMAQEQDNIRLRATLARGGAAYANQAGYGGMPTASTSPMTDSDPDAPDLVRAHNARRDAAEYVAADDDRVQENFIIGDDFPMQMTDEYKAAFPQETASILAPGVPPTKVHTAGVETGTASFVDPTVEILHEEVDSPQLKGPNPFEQSPTKDKTPGIEIIEETNAPYIRAPNPFHMENESTV